MKTFPFILTTVIIIAIVAITLLFPIPWEKIKRGKRRIILIILYAIVLFLMVTTPLQTSILNKSLILLGYTAIFAFAFFKSNSK